MHPSASVATGLHPPFLTFPCPLRSGAESTGIPPLHPAFLPQYHLNNMLALRPPLMGADKSKSFTIDAILGKTEKSKTSGSGRETGARRDMEGERENKAVQHPFLRGLTCPTALRYATPMAGPPLDLAKGRIYITAQKHYPSGKHHASHF